MATRIGCDNLVYAIMTTDNGISDPSYGEVKSAPGVMSLNINPNASQETIFYDDGPGESATTLGNIEVEIQKNELTTEQKADLLGHTIDSKGAIVYGANDTPPWVAIGFRTLKSSGKYRYVWLYKGKFLEPEDNSETKGDSINFQAETIVGQFVKVEKKYTIDGKEIQPWKYEIDAEYEEADSSLMATWFEEVKYPNSTATLAPTITASWAPGTETGSTSATITGSAGSGNHFAVKVSSTSLPTPNVGTLITGISTYVSGGDISAVEVGDFVGLYEVTATNTAVRFVQHTLIADDIKE
jgi:phi13 family phage major tail protein